MSDTSKESTYRIAVDDEWDDAANNGAHSLQIDGHGNIGTTILFFRIGHGNISHRDKDKTG
jgi:hypothetical protein